MPDTTAASASRSPIPEGPELKTWRHKVGLTLDDMRERSNGLLTPGRLSLAENDIQKLPPDRAALAAKILRQAMAERRREFNAILGQHRYDERIGRAQKVFAGLLGPMTSR